MKKIFSLLTLSLAVALSATAAPKVTITPLGDYDPNAPKPKQAVTTGTYMVNEDFSGFTAGTEDEPDVSEDLKNMVCDMTTEKIPAEYTHGQEWSGWKVYSAGGCVALHTINPMDAAYLQTPLGDYSGTVKISFKTKYHKVEWYDEEEGTMMHWSGAGINVGIGNSRNSVFNTSEGDIQNCYPWLADNIRLYEHMGWVQIDVEFDNYSAYNDSYVMFYCTDGVLIDDVKITTSNNKFVASPVISGISDVTDTSFAVNFEHVKNAMNTYVYLLELKGYDENGEPIYDVTYPQAMIDEVLKELAEYGMEMTWEEYKEMAELTFDQPYANIGKVEYRDKPYYVVEGLDPTKDYYVGLRAHYLFSFSDMAILPVKEIGVPPLKEPTNLTEDSFTANWDPITKADSYEVDLYGVNEATENVDKFIIFDEQFDNVSNYTDATNIFEPETVGAEQDVTIDDLTSTPGWTSSDQSWPIVAGKLGCSYYGSWVRTPELFVGNDDFVTISMKIEADTDGIVYLRFGDVSYQVPIENGVFEDEVIVPTNGVEASTMRFSPSDYFTFYIDYLVVMQNLQKGDRALTFLGTTPLAETSYAFADLDKDQFDMYGYRVRSVRGEDKEQVKSANSDIMIVDLKNGKSFTEVNTLKTANGATEVERYSIDGRRINGAQQGVNIVRFSDGTVKKVLVK